MAILIYLIKKNRTILLLAVLFLLIFLKQPASNAQGKMIDQIVAVIGNDMITQSDIENQVLQYKMENYYSDNMYCNVFEQFLIQKLLLNQAKVDSITVKPAQVEAELDRRMKYFIDQFGSRKKLEDYYQKSIVQIKEDLSFCNRGTIAGTIHAKQHNWRYQGYSI